MTTTIIANLEKLLGGPRDGALLRYSLGNEYLKVDDPTKAVEHLRAAIDRDPNFSAAWKLLGKALAEAGNTQAALDAFSQGRLVAERKGDIQAVKEMAVFARRLLKKENESLAQPPSV